jgi:hypothetical protein
MRCPAKMLPVGIMAVRMDRMVRVEPWTGTVHVADVSFTVE